MKNVLRLVLLLFCIACTEQETVEVLEENRILVDQIPDFTQTDIRGQKHNFGQMYCAPVAVSNAFAWLLNREKIQQDMVLTLASPKFMNTNPEYGTSFKDTLLGIEKYTRKKFGRYKSYAFQGHGYGTRAFQDALTPDFSFAKQHVGPGKALWLTIGYYQYDPSRNQYIRNGGHIVTAVGYRVTTEAHQLLIHDPATSNRYRHRSEVLTLHTLDTNAKLVGPLGDRIGHAHGKWALPNYLPGRSGMIAIVDGLIGLELNDSFLKNYGHRFKIASANTQ